MADVQLKLGGDFSSVQTKADTTSGNALCYCRVWETTPYSFTTAEGLPGSYGSITGINLGGRAERGQQFWGTTFEEYNIILR